MTHILLTGRTGQLGRELQRTLAPLGRVFALDRSQLDLTSADAIRKTVREINPGIIVNAAAYTAVDKAEAEPDLALQVNASAPAILAEEARRIDALLVHYSTDYVFDGRRSTPYAEDDAPNPLNVYGRSKLEGERAIAASGCSHLILRTSWLYSDRGPNFVLTMLRLAREKKELAVVNDQIGSPTWAHALAESSGELLGRIAGRTVETGVYHLSAEGYTSRFDFARAIIESAREITAEATGWAMLRPVKTAEYPLPATRPFTAITSKDKIRRIFGIRRSNWEAQLQSFLRQFITADNRQYILTPTRPVA